jgi:DNA invertase Pin-like site-specific DNA recombinase
MGRKGPGYISPDVQRESIQRWADYNGVRIVAWHEDYDESGGTQNRPGLRAAMDRIASGRTGGLACWRVDRFARNVGPAEADIELIRSHSARIAFTDENLDTSGPMGAFLMTTLLAMARLQRDRLSMGWATARGRAIARGAFIGKPPLGYRKIRDTNSEHAGCLEPDPQTAPIVQEAYRLAARDGLHAAARYLKRRFPDQRWAAFTTRRLLANRVYLGESRHGDELVNPAAHEPLVAVGTWIAAQADSVPTRMRSLEYPLSGVARCASCGGPLVGQIGHARKDGKAPRRYRCSFKWNDGEQCAEPASCLAEPLEDYIVGALRGLLDGVTVNLSDAEERLADLERELEQARADRLEFATDLEIKRSLGVDAYRAGCEARSQAVRRLEALYREEATRTTARELPLAAELDDPDQLQRALAAAIERIDVSRGRGPLDETRVTVVWRADEPASTLLAA